MARSYGSVDLGADKKPRRTESKAGFELRKKRCRMNSLVGAWEL